MNHNILRYLIVTIVSIVFIPSGISQTEMPEVFKKGNIPEQLTYIEERTRIYEFYRAVREDMFQQIKKNTLDSISASKAEIAELMILNTRLNITIDSLNTLIADTRTKLDEAIRTKNSIKVLGLEVNKFAYNTVMWILVAGLAWLLVMGSLAFKRNLIVTRNTRKDLNDLQAEFETYRKQSREAREKMSMEHFNELKKLRAHLSSGASAKEEGSELLPSLKLRQAKQGSELGATSEEKKPREAKGEIKRRKEKTEGEGSDEL